MNAQPLESLMVTVYVPSVNPVNVVPDWKFTPSKLYVYGAVPPVAPETVIMPSEIQLYGVVKVAVPMTVARVVILIVCGAVKHTSGPELYCTTTS